MQDRRVLADVLDGGEGEVFHQGAGDEKAAVAIEGVLFGAHDDGIAGLGKAYQFPESVPKGRSLTKMGVRGAGAPAQMTTRPLVADSGGWQRRLEFGAIELRVMPGTGKSAHVDEVCDVVSKEQFHKRLGGVV